MNPVTTLTLLTAVALTTSLSAGDPAMCGAPGTGNAAAGPSLQVSDGKSSVERSAEECAAQLPPERQSDLLILLNEANEDRLLTIRGVASTRAAAIVAARPIGSLSDLVGIKGIGLSTFKQILAHDPNAPEHPSAMDVNEPTAQAKR